MEGITTAFHVEVDTSWMLDDQPLETWWYEAQNDGDETIHQFLYDADTASRLLDMDKDPSRILRGRHTRHNRYGVYWSSGLPRADQSIRSPEFESPRNAIEPGVIRSRYTGRVIPAQRPYGYLSGRSRARSPYPRGARSKCSDDAKRTCMGRLLNAAKGLYERATGPVRRLIMDPERCA